jgi:hypothetical protein
MITIARLLDTKLEDAADLDHTDPAKAKAIRESALFYPPARAGPAHADGRDRAGLSRARSGQEEQCRAGQGRRPRQHDDRCALRTAVTVAQAMTNQRLVLEQITALNTTTANIIDSTGKLLRADRQDPRDGRLQHDPPRPSSARSRTSMTMDTIDTFKLKALDDEADGRNALGRSGKVARVYRADRGRQQGRRRTGRALAAEPGG